MWPYIYHRDHYKCFYCGFDGSTFPRFYFLTTEHVIPKQEWELCSRFGLVSLEQNENLVTACSYCNTIENKWTVPDGINSIEDLKKNKKQNLSSHIQQGRDWLEKEIRPILNQPLEKFEETFLNKI